MLFTRNDFGDDFKFDQCLSNEDFLREVVNIYFSAKELRLQEATLSVYMAYRDHYPSYLRILTQEQIRILDDSLIHSSGKIIKLRRIVISALAKVA